MVFVHSVMMVNKLLNTFNMFIRVVKAILFIIVFFLFLYC